MLIRVNVQLNWTEECYYRGNVRLATQDCKQLFTFTLSDPLTDKQQLMVRRDERMFMDVHGMLDSSNPSLVDLSWSQLILLRLIGHGVSSTLGQIRSEIEGSRLDVEKVVGLWAELGMACEISATKEYDIEITEPEQQLHAMQLFNDNA